MRLITLLTLAVLLIIPSVLGIIYSLCMPIKLKKSYEIGNYKIELIVPLDVEISAPRTARPGSTVTIYVNVRQLSGSYISVGGSRGQLPDIGREARIDIIKGSILIKFRSTVVVFLRCEGPCSLDEDSLFFERAGSRSTKLHIDPQATEGDEVVIEASPEYRAEISFEVSQFFGLPVPLITVPSPSPIVERIVITERTSFDAAGSAVMMFIPFIVVIFIVVIALLRRREGEQGMDTEGGEGEWRLDDIIRIVLLFSSDDLLEFTVRTRHGRVLVH